MKKYYKYTLTAVFLADCTDFQEDGASVFLKEADDGCLTL